MERDRWGCAGVIIIIIIIIIYFVKRKINIECSLNAHNCKTTVIKDIGKIKLIKISSKKICFQPGLKNIKRW